MEPEAQDQSAEAAFPPCPACGHNEWLIIFDRTFRSPMGNVYSVRDCQRCGLGVTYPLPSDEELTELYSTEFYRANEPRQRGLLVRLGHALVRRVGQERESYLVGLSPGRILDIGCGNGEFLRRAGGLGWNTYGTEYSLAAVELARRYVDDVRLANSSKAEFEPDFFDAVSLFNVLEHVPDPVETIRETRRVLKPNGRLIIQVPNHRSLSFTLFRDRCFALDVPRHLYHWTPKALVTLLRNEGFRVEHFEGFNFLTCLYITYHSMMLARHQKGRPIILFDPAFERAGTKSKLTILAKSLPLLAASLPIVLAEWRRPLRGESMTVLCRKQD